MKTLTVFLAFLLVAKFALVVARGPAAVELDAREYWRLSTLVLHGDVLLLNAPIAYRTPGYPWFLAGMRAVFGSAALPAIVITQAAMLIASVLIAAVLSMRISGRSRALTLTIAFALPMISMTSYATAVLSESLFTFLLMVHLLAVWRLRDRGDTASAVGMGVTFAATLLTRPIGMLLWVAHAVFIIWVLPTRSAVARLAVFAFVTLALVSPWLVRNAAMFGKPFLTEFVGRNAFVVTFQGGSGAGLPLPDSPAGNEIRSRMARVNADPSLQTWNVSDALVRSGLDDAAADGLMKRACLDAIGRSPGPAAFKTVRRLANFWRTPATWLPEPAEDPSLAGQRFWRRSIHVIDRWFGWRTSRSVAANTFVMITLALAVLILTLGRSTRAAGVWVGLVLVYFNGVTGVIEIPDYRYRAILEPLAAGVFAAAVITLRPASESSSPP